MLDSVLLGYIFLFEGQCLQSIHLLFLQFHQAYLKIVYHLHLVELLSGDRMIDINNRLYPLPCFFDIIGMKVIVVIIIFRFFISLLTQFRNIL